jgi:hypothetical protein
LTGATSNFVSRTTAMAQLASLVSSARKSGYVGEELEARLARAEIEMKAGKAASARYHLTVIEKEARAKGFGLVAQKANSLHSGG